MRIKRFKDSSETVACNLLEDVEIGVKFGQLALQVVSQLDARAFKPQVLQIVAGFLIHRKSNLKETLPLLQEAYTSAISVTKSLPSNMEDSCTVFHNQEKEQSLPLRFRSKMNN